MSGSHLRAVALLIAGLAAACAGDNGPDNGVLTTVEVTPTEAELFTVAPGNSVTLAVVARNADGQAMSGTSATFTSSASQVATVSNAGVVTAVGPGTAQITASVTASGTTVTKATPVTVTVAPGTATVTAPQFAFTPGVTDVAAGGTVTWSVGDIHHDVAFSTAGAPADVPELQNTSASRTFPTNGTFAYHCTFHSTMQGQVRVH